MTHILLPRTPIIPNSIGGDVKRFLLCSSLPLALPTDCTETVEQNTPPVRNFGDFAAESNLSSSNVYGTFYIDKARILNQTTGFPRTVEQFLQKNDPPPAPPGIALASIDP